MEAFPGTLQKGFVERTHRTKKGMTGKQHKLAYVLTDEQREWLCGWFPEVENKRLMKASGMSASTLHRFAMMFGLKKSEEGLQGIWKRNIAKIKRACERNGYYDSLRGKKPSDACQNGFQNYLQDVKNGKRLSHMKVLKNENPCKYNKMMRTRSKSRKELYRKEKFRQEYGLKRHTKMRIVLYCYTRSQICRRYSAIKRGYILMEDCSEQGGERYNIYYDDDTERSEKFENNLKNDGFNVKPYNNDETE